MNQPTPLQYEKVVRDFLAAQTVGGFTAHHDKHYLGKATGHSHQVDVSLEGSIAGARFIILVECKLYRRRVGLEKVMALAFRLWDTGANKGIVVSASGFQRGSFKIASAMGMSLVVCRNQLLTFELQRSYEEPVSRFLMVSGKSDMPIEYATLVSDGSCEIGNAMAVVAATRGLR
jgi:hypothetical protein